MSEFQRKLEIQIMAAARRSKATMEEVAALLDGYVPSEQTLSWIWDKFKGAWKKRELARLETLQAMVESEPLEAHEALLETVVEVWRSTPSTTPKADCEVLNQLFRHDRMAKGMDRAVKAMARGDLDNARDVMAGLVQESNVDQGLVVEALIDFDDWNGELADYNGIPTGIATYDEVTEGGASRGELGIILGNTGMGKSLLATNFGFTGIKHNLKVLHIDSENGLDKVKARYIARALRVPSRPLERRRLNDDIRRWMERQAQRINSLLKLINIGVDQTPLEKMEAAVYQLVESGWKPDVLVTDSPDHCPVPSKMDNAGMIAQMRYARMKAMAQKLDAVHWVVTQAKPESEGKIVTTKHIAWGHDKARLADHVLTINPGLDQSGNPLNEKSMGGKRSMFVAKARGSAGRFIIPLNTDLATAYITEDIEGPSGKPEETLD